MVQQAPSMKGIDDVVSTLVTYCWFENTMFEVL